MHFTVLSIQDTYFHIFPIYCLCLSQQMAPCCSWCGYTWKADTRPNGFYILDTARYTDRKPLPPPSPLLETHNYRWVRAVGLVSLREFSLNGARPEGSRSLEHHQLILPSSESIWIIQHPAGLVSESVPPAAGAPPVNSERKHLSVRAGSEYPADEHHGHSCQLSSPKPTAQLTPWHAVTWSVRRWRKEALLESVELNGSIGGLSDIKNDMASREKTTRRNNCG